MNDLNLGPNSGRVKCAKICGDTSGNYTPMAMAHLPDTGSPRTELEHAGNADR